MLIHNHLSSEFPAFLNLFPLRPLRQKKSLRRYHLPISKTEFLPPSPSSIEGAPGSGSQLFPSTTKRYSYRPSGSSRVTDHAPFLSGPESGFLRGSHRLKLPAMATLEALGAMNANRTAPSRTSGPGRFAEQDSRRRNSNAMMRELTCMRVRP